ncbi:MAG: hypothetical protein XD93_0679 [candidate division WS6 bacterium 34_10]|uniref:Uncharacterized protein n=1 Tax=candidate division WS6 bacterium 34_10 TaxID=1641389 RepID=A0A101HHR0_9BACT|nr:MAG: hypothetical protein XD93_0679 [candidate division WS6 bacterium 34_10]
MAKFLKNLFLFLLIFYFSTSIFTGIVMPEIPLYFFATLFVLSMAVLMTEPFLKFLTIQINFLTYWLMSSIILTGISFLLRIFMTGFFVENSEFAGLSLSFVEINGFVLNPILTILVFSVTSGIISAVFYVLEKSD